MNSLDNNFGRRKFFKRVALGASSLAGVACSKSDDVKSGKMTLRETPSTGDKVSILGYGCMRWPSLDGKTARNSSNIDQDAVNRLVDIAIANGVNYFDTSPAYCKGMSERATGLALSRHPRNKYFIATKLSNFSPKSWSREASIAIYKNSFKELRVDYIDYMLLHSVGGGNGMQTLKSRYLDNGILEFLMAERAAGRIRNLGFSYHGDVEVFDYLLSKHDYYKWDFVQIQMNFIDWKHAKQVNSRNTNAEYLYGELDKRKIPVVIMEPLLGGRLAAVPHTLIPEFKRREPNNSVASWSFRFAGSFPRVLTVLSGMDREEHLLENIQTYSPLKPLKAEDYPFLEIVADKMLKLDMIPCNDCKYCMPCPYALDIPAILLHYNKCLNEKNLPNSVENENYSSARRAYLVGYDRAVPKLRSAEHCTGCGQCLPHCPQRIDIPKELKRIDRYVRNLRTQSALMGDVRKKFDEGKYSCVIGNGKIETFTNKGIKDLIEIYKTRPELLRGALVADKIIGRAAASILIVGGISELYAGVITKDALKMLVQAKIPTTYGKRIDTIQNREKTGICPMETLCKNAPTPESCLKLLLKKFE